MRRFRPVRPRHSETVRKIFADTEVGLQDRVERLDKTLEKFGVAEK